MAPILVWYILFFLSYRSDKWQVNSIDLPWKKFAYNVIFYLLYKKVRKKYNTQNNESKAQTKSEGNGQRKETTHTYTPFRILQEIVCIQCLLFSLKTYFPIDTSNCSYHLVIFVINLNEHAFFFFSFFFSFRFCLPNTKQ